MTLQLHKPDGQGGLAPRTDAPKDWRAQLRSTRWRPARLANPEMNPTRSWVAVAFWLVLGILTFALLVAGYGSHLWSLPALPTPGA